MVRDQKCTLCGVALNLARIRTLDEPLEHAWSSYSSEAPGRSFADAFEGRNEGAKFCIPADWSYLGQKGCMAAFREDVAWRLRVQSGHVRRSEEKLWKETVFSGLQGQRIDLETSEGDEDWVPQLSDGEEEMSEEEVQYEYEGDNMSETCGADQIEGSDSEIDTEVDMEHHTWVDKITAQDVYPHGYHINRLSSDEYEQVRQLAEEFRIRVPTEVRLPWRIPIDAVNESTRLKYEQKRKYKDLCYREGTETSIPSYWFHPFNALSNKEPHRVWEHLAGPECYHPGGYNGNRISAEEMLHCNVVQGLKRKDPDTAWETESTDEDWEGHDKPRWHLTGLKDHVDSSGEPYPRRHLVSADEQVGFDSVYYGHSNIPLAMAFHPPCLEVYKRVSLKRNGQYDISALGNWWAAMDFHGINRIPRNEDVVEGIGYEETWCHEIGGEYLAANPCFVPLLKKLLASCKKSATRHQGSVQQHELPALPIEIQHLIMSYLETIEIASLGAALSGFRNAAKDALEKSLLHEMPYLWELWCEMPYSKWLGTTAAELKAAQTGFEEEEAEIARILDVLDEEGYHEVHAEYKQYWDDGQAERKAKSRVSLQEEPSDFVSIEDIDIVNFVYRLCRTREDNRMKGLKNRERIWRDCNVILDRVEAFQKKGKIPASQD